MGVPHEDTNISRSSPTYASPSIRGMSLKPSNSVILMLRLLSTQPVHFNVFLELAMLYAPCNNKLKLHLRNFLDNQVWSALPSIFLTAPSNRQSISTRVCHGLGSKHKGCLLVNIPHHILHPAKPFIPFFLSSIMIILGFGLVMVKQEMARKGKREDQYISYPGQFSILTTIYMLCKYL